MKGYVEKTESGTKRMGKGRAPCCDKSKVKRGPWSPQEDLTLITLIQKHGHHNWRSLPKLAGLVRCGKSCRLRWINYLRPDVKRGNFTKEEEDAIIHFHQTLGNKWSKIASYLPGRTDNEIKNVWNTHLKKRLSPNSSLPSSSTSTSSSISCIHDQTAEANNDKNCDLVQEEGHSGFNESQDSPSSSHLHDTTQELHEVNQLQDIQLLLDHDDFADITSEFLQTNEMLFPELPLDSFLHHHQSHIPTEFRKTDEAPEEVTKPQSFDHPQPDIKCGFEETNGEFDLWTQLVEASSPAPSPDTEEYNDWFNFIGNPTYFDDFTLVGEVCL